MKQCEKCKKVESRSVRIEYNEELDEMLCGQCDDDFEASLEEYEESKRRRLQEQNEY